MAPLTECQEVSNIPQVVLLIHLPQFLLVNRPLPTNFHFLKPYESPLSLHDFLASHAQSAQALLTYGRAAVTSDILSLLPNLRLVVTASAGLNHIDLPECRRRGIAITSAGDVYSDDVADLAVGLLIDVWRKITASDRYVRHGLWSGKGDYPLGFKLGGKRVGIIGLGRIGLQVARRLEAFGCTILYNSREEKSSVSYPFFSNVCELASNSDALIICCGLSDETHHMINKDVMKSLGPNGVIVNIARGPIIDENEMVRRLVQGELGGAGLDVFENEPNVPKELFDLDNVVMTPHNAAFTSESLSDMCDLVVGNLDAFFSNKPLLSPVLNE